MHGLPRRRRAERHRADVVCGLQRGSVPIRVKSDVVRRLREWGGLSKSAVLVGGVVPSKRLCCGAVRCVLMG